MSTPHWKSVWECESRSEAEVLKTYLESHGIRVFLQGGESNYLYPVLRVRVLVPEEDLEKARELTELFFKSGD